MYLNKVFLYGNLTRDPELKSIPSGNLVASFGLATNRSFIQKDGQKKEQTEFHNIIAFGKTADIIGQYLKKGRPVFIDGRLQTRSWEKEGAKQYRTEIIVDSFQFGPSSERENVAGETKADKFDKTPDPDKTYKSSAEDVTNYPDSEINPEDIPF